MKKLTTLYGKKKSTDTEFWMKKMYSIKAKNLHECKGVINGLNEIFEKLESSNIKLTDLEKIRIMFLAFPKFLRDHIQTNGKEVLPNFRKR